MRLRWYRYWAVLVGQESGNTLRPGFPQFRRLEDAQRWCAEQNLKHIQKHPEPLTLWGFEEIP